MYYLNILESLTHALSFCLSGMTHVVYDVTAPDVTEPCLTGTTVENISTGDAAVDSC